MKKIPAHKKLIIAGVCIILLILGLALAHQKKLTTEQLIDRALIADNHNFNNYPHTVSIIRQENGYVKFHIDPKPGIEMDSAVGYAQLKNNTWVILNVGTGGDLTDFYKQYSIPKTLQDSLTLTPSPSPVKQSKQAIWKTYTSEKGYFSIQYPPHWKALMQPYAGEPFKTIMFSGKEGNVIVSWGTGFGGACGGDTGPALEKIAIDGESFDVCHEKDTIAPGSESWINIGKEFGIINGKDVGVFVSAQANAPATTNRAVVLQVLQSLKFLK